MAVDTTGTAENTEVENSELLDNTQTEVEEEEIVSPTKKPAKKVNTPPPPAPKSTPKKAPKAAAPAPVEEEEYEEAEEEPPAGKQQSKTPAAKDTPDKVDYAEYQRKMRENANLRDRMKSIQAQLDELSESKTKAEELELRESEKLRAKLKEVETQQKAAAEELQEQKLARTIENAARAMGFNDPGDAIPLIWAKVEPDDDDKPTNVKDLLTKLAKGKPYLLKDLTKASQATTEEKAPPPNAGSAANPPRTAQSAQGLTKEAIEALPLDQFNKLWKDGVIQEFLKSNRK